MRSTFTMAPFAKFDLGTHALRASSKGMQAAFIGQPQAFAVSDWLERIGLDPADIDKISDTTVRAQLKAEYEKCQGMGLTSADGLACLAKLGADVYLKLQEQEKAPVPTVRPTTPAASDFPIVPVAIAGVAALGLIYYLATRKG